ncbi:MAG: CarD family transcriptional regulator [Hyphomicrobiaceae bacterium]
MAQKKKVPAKSLAKKTQPAKASVRAAASAPASRKTSDAKVTRPQKPPKSPPAKASGKALPKIEAGPKADKAKPTKAPPAAAIKAANAKKAGAEKAKAPIATERKAPATKPATARPVASSQPARQPADRPAAAKPMGPPPAAPAQSAARSVATAAPKQAVKAVTPPASPRDIATKAVEARQTPSSIANSKKPVSQRHGFKTNEYIVYPAHGVGRIIGIEEQEIAGMSLELFVIQFEKDKMTLRVPTGKLQSVGMRKLAADDVVSKAMTTLKGRARIKRTMWSRRAQEYETKINSGDLVSIAEVVRDLYRSESQPEQSYSERQLYEAALDRMAREIAAVEHLDERGAVQRITDVLAKSAKGRRLAMEAAVENGAEDADVKAA